MPTPADLILVEIFVSTMAGLFVMLIAGIVWGAWCHWVRVCRDWRLDRMCDRNGRRRPYRVPLG
jgi:uncharacterized membrane protein